MRRGLRVLPVAVLLTFAASGVGNASSEPPPTPTPKAKSSTLEFKDPEIAGGHDHQHGGNEGHLPGTSKNMELVAKLDVSGATGENREGHIADVAVFGQHAYLAARRLNTNPCGAGGFYTVDISDPKQPKELSFTAFPAGSYPGEGMQVITIDTASFKGDILVTNNEICSDAPEAVGGMSIYSVTDPKNIVPLAVGKGDFNDGTQTVANQEHSVFAWQAGERAFAMMSDDEEQSVGDVDIMEITDPANPTLIAETSIADWPTAEVGANGQTVFLHDMQIKKVRDQWLGLLSYWDAGWVILNLTDPAKPVFLADSKYPDPDKLLGFTPPEGNGHQAEWTRDNKFIVGTDEDFSPSRTSFQVTSGPNAGTYGAGEFDWTVPINTLPGQTFQGAKTVWGGTGCEEDVNGNGISDRAEVPTKAASGADVVVFTRGACFFSVKVESGQLAGYDKVIVIQSHVATSNGRFADGFFCGAQGHDFTITASAICVGHRAGHLLFEDAPEYTSAPEGSDMPALGTIGAGVKATTTFDGWGTVHLLDGKTLKEIDNYAISEALDPAFASGFGDLSVHEVATDPERSDLAYLSYYAGGMRVIKVGAKGIEEVGRYINEDGNNFWGVEAQQIRGKTYVFGSDRDSGLWIFRYTGR
ncbi:hypothetical protein GCM10010404_59010 [Nonomuraea africana]|uniref:LVIVD repeat-containing protein n=1 Tax=Nonomuraea africana TaxID=46171 RepID=A0ABR9KBD5_9ACTN|nr:hypothetical protein [Nonomuraea africana]MBE1559033.1 hypothetical protein [Nonomuraea africana]